MAEETHVHDTTSSRGAQWAGAGSLIALAAQSLLNGGALGGILGGGNAVAQGANTAFALEMAKKDCEIARLQADAATDKKLVDVYTTLRANDKEQDAKISLLREDVHALDKRISETNLVASNGITQLSGAYAALKQTVDGITATYVPATSVTPLPMQRYNFWQAPTEPANGARKA